MGWIHLCTPQHTGTHFVRFLLELHPRVSFWKCERTVTAGRTLQQWHAAFSSGEISWEQLLRLGICCPADLPAWTLQEAQRLGLELPPKLEEHDLVHTHCGRRFTTYPALKTVFAVRDPLPAVITGLRRGGPEAAESIIAGIQFVARVQRDYGFCFCVDLWREQPRRALALLDYLRLEPTPEIHEFLRRWPALNVTDRRHPLVRDEDPAWRAARRLAVQRRGVHPLVEPWAQRIRDAGLQPFYEHLGYGGLPWYG